VEATAAAPQDEDVPQGAARRLTCEETETEMDGRQFDALAATLGEERSRRGFSRLLAGGALGAFAAIALREAGDAKANGGQHAASDRGPAANKAKNGRATAASDGKASTIAPAKKRRRRCRSAQSLCSTNGQCCPSTSGYVCSWNGNAAGASVCCGVENSRCFDNFDCCGQAICLLGVCTNLG